MWVKVNLSLIVNPPAVLVKGGESFPWFQYSPRWHSFCCLCFTAAFFWTSGDSLTRPFSVRGMTRTKIYISSTSALLRYWFRTQTIVINSVDKKVYKPIINIFSLNGCLPSYLMLAKILLWNRNIMQLWSQVSFLLHSDMVYSNHWWSVHALWRATLK